MLTLVSIVKPSVPTTVVRYPARMAKRRAGEQRPDVVIFVREEFRRYGAQGGRTRAQRLSQAERTRIARAAAQARWAKAKKARPAK
jgi:hypothetical protein